MDILRSRFSIFESRISFGFGIAPLGLEDQLVDDARADAAQDGAQPVNLWGEKLVLDFGTLQSAPFFSLLPPIHTEVLPHNLAKGRNPKQLNIYTLMAITQPNQNIIYHIIY